RRTHHPLTFLSFLPSPVRLPPPSTLFPYTTLFRSADGSAPACCCCIICIIAICIACCWRIRWIISSRFGKFDASSTPSTSMALRSEEHTSELQSRENLVCRLLLEKKKKITRTETGK